MQKYSVKEYAKIVGKSDRTIRKWITDGKLKAIKEKGKYFINVYKDVNLNNSKNALTKKDFSKKYNIKKDVLDCFVNISSLEVDENNNIILNNSIEDIYNNIGDKITSLTKEQQEILSIEDIVKRFNLKVKKSNCSSSLYAEIPNSMFSFFVNYIQSQGYDFSILTTNLSKQFFKIRFTNHLVKSFKVHADINIFYKNVNIKKEVNVADVEEQYLKSKDIETQTTKANATIVESFIRDVLNNFKAAKKSKEIRQRLITKANTLEDIVEKHLLTYCNWKPKKKSDYNNFKVQIRTLVEIEEKESS